MSKLKNNKPLLIVLAIQCIILLLAAGNFILCKFNLYSTTIFPNEMICASDVVYEDKISANMDNSTAGTLASTAPLQLNRGSYLVYINYSADTDGNTISALSYNILPQNFLSNENTLYAADRSSTLSFRIKSAGEVIIETNYCGDGSFEISELHIVETTDMAKQDFLTALFVCLLIMLGYYIFTTTLSKRNTCLALCGIVILSSYPLLLDYLIIGHDIPYHLLRIDAIRIGLQNGIFPVKIYPMMVYDYGYASGVFYGDLLLYYPALLRQFGLTLQTTFQFFLFTTNIATVLIAYYCFKNLFKSNKWGLVASMLYTLSSYRLFNVYTRAAVGELCAMMFLPLIFLGLYRIFTQKKEDKFDWRLIIMPTIGLTGVIQTHTLSCLMVGIVIIITCIILIKKTLQSKIFYSLLLTLGLTLLLNAGFLVPFADYYITEDFLINSSEWGGLPVQSLGLYFPQIFSTFQESGGPTNSTITGIPNEISPNLGLALSVGLLVCAYYIFTHTKEERKHSSFGLIIFTFICSVLTIYMTSYLFPWNAISNSCGFGASLVSSLQFPWRFLSLSTLFLTVCLCQVLKNMAERQKENSTLPFTPIAIIVLCLCTLISSGWYYYSYLYNGTPYRVYETYELPSYQIYTCEYLPANTELYNTVYERYHTSTGINIISRVKEGTSMTLQIQNTGADGFLEVPLLNYKGYTAIDCETNSKLAVSNGYNNCVRIEIPSGFDSTIEVGFSEPVYWRIAEIISILTAAFLAINTFIKYKRSRKTTKE